ncbi:MAG: LPS export ABC transporter periplasmic protein LptC [Endomicrobia bacterium]|nr:LPS export ABC transporter periplasmic protein LptC [Endomicrobiia bacterium]
MVKKINFVFFMLFFLLISCEDKNLIKIEENKESSLGEILPTITDFSITKIKDNKKLWDMQAKVAVLRDDIKAIDIERGKVSLYDGDIFVAKVIFEKARFFEDTNDINFFGKSIIHTVENEKIITYDIKYVYNQNKIFSDKEIEIHKGDSIIRGIGFETLDGFKTIRIYKNVISTQ